MFGWLQCLPRLGHGTVRVGSAERLRTGPGGAGDLRAGSQTRGLIALPVWREGAVAAVLNVRTSVQPPLCVYESALCVCVCMVRLCVCLSVCVQCVCVSVSMWVCMCHHTHHTYIVH